MKRLLVDRLALAVALACSTVAAQAEAPFSFASTPGQLPKDIVPQQYAVHLVPNLPQRSFMGAETVEIDVLKSTSRIVLNAANMDIDSASLSGKNLPDLALTPKLDKDKELLSFDLAAPLAPGRYTLSLKYRGKIADDSRGLYRITAPGGKELAVTQMEATDARRMFPNWDEPVFRARFKLTVDVPAKMQAYSNMPVEQRETLDGGLQRLHFGSTPKMASYLVMLGFGDFERLSAKQDNVDIGVVTVPGKQNSAKFALASSRDLLHYYNNYFGQPYPLPKLDHVAVPGGFAGAMENWGAIVYTENAILYEPGKSPESTKRESFRVVGHEMAHQWFGDLVTMAWWDNLWLNEGFASWMETKASEFFHPEWRPWLESATDREGVMNTDARKTTHPIQRPIENEAQAAAAFDNITYIKGQAFLRMLENYLGEDAFRRGIRAYMAKHQYSSSTTADLWAALEQASGKPVAKLASAWTTQPGFPLVKVAQRCENGKRIVTLSQQVFRVDEPATEPTLWPVPVRLGTLEGKTHTYLLSEASNDITLPSCEGTLVADPWGVGYFRLAYDATSAAALAAKIDQLPDGARMKLLSDSWAQVMAGQQPLNSYLDLAARYSGENRLAIWVILTRNAGTLLQLTRGTPEHELVQRALVKLAKPRFDALGWDERPNETAETRELRARLAGSLAAAEDPATVAELQRRFQQFVLKPSSVAVDMVDLIVGTAGRYADEASYAQLSKLAEGSTSTEERSRYYRAMASAKNPEFAKRSLQLLLRDDLPQPVRWGSLLNVSYADHMDLAWDFAVANRETLFKVVDFAGRMNVMPGILGWSADAARADQLEAYVKANFDADYQKEAHRVAEAIRVRAKQKQQLLPQIRAALH